MEVKQLGNMDEDRENFANPQTGRVYDVSGLSPTLNTCGGGQREVKILEDKIADEVTPDGAEIYDLIRIRKLTPKECWRLMGFTDEDFEKAENENSNTQLYKQAGNSIVTTCLMAIFSQLHIEGCPVWNELNEDARNELIDRTRKYFTPEIQSDERDFDEDDEETADSLNEEEESEGW